MECHVCKSEIPSERLHVLAGMDATSRARGGGVHLCEDCLVTRQAEHWSAPSPKYKRLVRALEDRDGPKHGRYAFLADGASEIRLVRLRDDWIRGVAYQRAETVGPPA